MFKKKLTHFLPTTAHWRGERADWAGRAGRARHAAANDCARREPRHEHGRKPRQEPPHPQLDGPPVRLFYFIFILYFVLLSSNKPLKHAGCRVITNKLIMITIIIVLMGILGIVVYFKLKK
jgi:hypothetical protein